MIRVYAWKLSDQIETEREDITFATAWTGPVTVRTCLCTPEMTLLSTPVRSLSSARLMMSASFVLTRARRVRTLSWGGEGERELDEGSMDIKFGEFAIATFNDCRESATETMRGSQNRDAFVKAFNSDVRLQMYHKFWHRP